MRQGYCMLTISREQKRPVRLGHLDEYWTDRLHGVEKTLHSEYGEISNICRKELTSTLLLYQIFTGVFSISVQRFTFSRIHRPVESHCARGRTIKPVCPCEKTFYVFAPPNLTSDNQTVGGFNTLLSPIH